MSIRPAQKFILDNKTRSSQRISRNSKIPSPRKEINENPRPIKKVKRRNNSRQFDIYEDIDIELEGRNIRESSILNTLPEKSRITVEIPRRQPF